MAVFTFKTGIILYVFYKQNIGNLKPVFFFHVDICFTDFLY